MGAIWSSYIGDLFEGGRLLDFGAVNDPCRLPTRAHSQQDGRKPFSEGPSTCPSLYKSANLMQVTSFPCHSQHPFICEYDYLDGQGCTRDHKASWNSMMPTSLNFQDQRWFQLQRSKRFLSETPIDVSNLMNSLNIDSTLKGLVGHINDLMQDDEERSLQDLEQEVTLLFQLSEKLKDPGIRSAHYISNLTSMAYYGINSILQTVLSTCSANDWTVAEKQNISQSSVAVLYNLGFGKILDLTDNKPLFLMKTPVFSTQIVREKSSQLCNKILAFEGDEKAASVVFPEVSPLSKALQNGSSVNIQLTSFLQNPFPSESSLNISGTVSSLSILSGSQEVKVQDLPGYFQIFLPRPETAPVTPSVIKANGGNMVLLTFQVTPPSSTLVVIVKAIENITLELSLWHNNISTLIKSTQNSTSSGNDPRMTKYKSYILSSVFYCYCLC
ncbi:hypothetical protein NDU88_003793 [Pleurodeles waltl]|uniref:Uncharacterized protein n=1 Tax=Pleurodeles waltl TaxID=8319 RepID=A0AAV7L4W8_PLEWA|nr:hypothetical protein NDU88_003793 [Pleurodeles waltl]